MIRLCFVIDEFFHSFPATRTSRMMLCKIALGMETKPVAMSPPDEGCPDR
jgi:hypothetical protein